MGVLKAAGQGEVAGQSGFTIDVEPVDDRVRSVDDARRRTFEQRDLHVVIVIVEEGAVEADATVEKVRLEAHFIGLKRFRIEGRIGYAFSIEAAALEAGVERSVGQDLV